MWKSVTTQLLYLPIYVFAQVNIYQYNHQNLKIDICLFNIPSQVIFSSAKRFFHFRKYVFLYIRISNKFRLLHIFSPKRPLWLNVNTQTTSFIRNLSRLQGLRCQSFLVMGLGFFSRVLKDFVNQLHHYSWVRMAKVRFESGSVSKNSGFRVPDPITYH